MSKTTYNALCVCVLVILVLILVGVVSALMDDETTKWHSVIYSTSWGVAGSLIASILYFVVFNPEEFLQKYRDADLLLKQGIRHLYADSGALKDDDWAAWINSTPPGGTVHLLGISNSEWVTANSKSREALKCLMKNNGCDVYVYFLDPAPEGGPNYADLRAEIDDPNEKGATKNRIKKSIDNFRFLKAELGERKASLHLFKYNEIPSQAIYFNGKSVHIKNYLRSASNDKCPIVFFETPNVPRVWSLDKLARDDIGGDFLFDFISHLKSIANGCSSNGLEITE